MKMLTNTRPDIIDRLFSAGEKWDIEAYVACFTQDAVYQAANSPPVRGHEGIVNLAQAMHALFSKVTHRVNHVWQMDNVVCCELEVTYVRNKDGKVVIVPCCDVIEMDGEKIKAFRAYLDPSPALAD